MSKWWAENMSDAGQGLFSDPSTALAFATTPDQLLKGQSPELYDQSMVAEQARNQRAGVMQQLMGAITSAGSALDGALSHVPGWGVTKNVGDALIVKPIDKLASGMYWAYSEVLSQPLSTAMLVGGKANIYGPGQFFSGDAWSDAYHKAEHISPGQAFYNVNRMTFSDLSKEVGAEPGTDLNDDQKRQMERFIYDNDYWRNRDGWKYTLGTGTLDFAANIFDPVGGAVAAGAKAVKAGRSAQAVEGLSEAQKAKRVLPAKTAEEISQGERMNKAFDWMDGKSAFEISQHPMWGRGRRKVAERYALSEIFSKADRDEMPLIMRYAMGDNKALTELNASSQSLVATLGAAQDNRALLAGHAWDGDILDSYVRAAHAGQPMPVGVVAPGQDALYQGAAQYAASKRIQSNYGNSVWIRRATQWQGGQVAAADAAIANLMTKEDWYAKALGENFGKAIDEVTPTDGAHLFGTVKQAYRMGPLAARDTENAANKAISAATVDRVARDATGSNMVTRLVQRGYYNLPVRVYQSFGDRVPQGFVDHNADDASDRVLDMLKRVPGMGEQQRLNMLQQYSAAGDKVARSTALDAIQRQVVLHMVGRHNLNDDVAGFASDIISRGFEKSMYEISGRTPNASRFTAAKSQSGQFLDVIEDGYGRRVAPYLKSQLQASDPLLDVDQLDKILNRNSGHFALLTSNGGKVIDNAKTFLDSFNGMWKASTLLRAGYALRAPSEEIVAGAVKFGLLSAMADAGRGTANFFRNGKQNLKIVTRQDGKVDVLEPNAVAAARAQGLPVESVEVNKAFPFVQRYLSDHRDRLKQLETQSRRIGKQMQTVKDPAKLQDLTLQKQNVLDAIDDAKGTIDEFTDYSHELMRQASLPTKRRLGEGTFTYRGQEIPQAFNREWAGVIPRDQISSESSMASIFARAEAIERANLIKTGSWTTVTPDMPNYMESWLGAINKQLGNDPVARLLMQDSTGQSALNFLKSPVGRQHMMTLSRQAQDPEKLIGIIKQTMDQYIPEGSGLRQKVLNGEEVAEQDLRRIFSTDDMPTVHGDELASVTAGKKSTSQNIDDIIAKGFKRLGTIPTDIMSRQPIYVRAHSAHMRDLIDKEMSFLKEQGLPETVSPEALNKMMGVADKRARNTLSQVVYDPTRTTATEALRFMSPFMAAHVDGLERWFGLVAEKPELLNVASKIYNAPVAANLVTDKEGRVVDQNGYAVTRDKDGNIVKRDFVPLSDRILNLKIPGETKNVKGIGEVPAGAGFSLPLSSLNTIMPGDPWWHPGSGPLVQIAGSKLAEKSPGLGEFMVWAKVLPYGPQGVMESITPAYMKNLWSAWQGDDPDNTQFQKTLLEEYQRQQAEFANGGDAPDMKKAVENAKSFMYLKALTSWASPSSVTTSPLRGTPYQFFVDQYKQLQDLDPKNAADIFLATYGADYYGFTSSMNKSIGINSTVPAVETAKKYKDIITEHPDLAALIIGPYNQGKFSQVANKQLGDLDFGGVSGKEKMTAREAVDNNERLLGWKQYQKLIGLVDAGLIRNGFRSYEENGAEKFKLVKAQITANLAGQYPAWEKDFSETDKNVVPRRIDAMREIVNDDRLMSDPMRTDLHTLKLYLQVRDAMQQQLMKRESSDLTSKDNRDLAIRWGQLQLGLVQQDTRFNDLFNRYLANDSLQMSLGANVQRQRAQMGIS